MKRDLDIWQPALTFSLWVVDRIRAMATEGTFQKVLQFCIKQDYCQLKVANAMVPLSEGWLSEQQTNWLVADSQREDVGGNLSSALQKQT